MLTQDCSKLDPRIRRTRHLLQDSLRHLLEEKELEEISVQDITERATLNRATFYAHYTDKFALLGEMIRVNFLQLLEKRNVRFDGTCPSALRALTLAVCDFLVDFQPSISTKQHQFGPFLQTTVIDQIRIVLLDGFHQHPAKMRASAEVIAATASWAIFGAVKEWASDPKRVPPEAFVSLALELVGPILATVA